MKKLSIAVLCFSLTMGVTSCKETGSKDSMKEMTHEDDGSHEHNADGSHMEDGDAHDHSESKMVGKTVTVSMGSKSGSNVSGSIILEQKEKEVMMSVALSGLTQGSHAIHIHQNGDCSSDDGKSAGGHWNPTDEKHGKWGENMHHSGDIGNLEVGEDGTATLEFSTDKWCLGCDTDTHNIMGKAFIVHASADDFESQPSGAAGARVACGVIK